MSDDHPPVPKYYRVQEDLREKISEWDEGEMIPSEKELCEMYSVSRITVRRAIKNLVQDGWLDRIQGKGTFVTKPTFRREHRERLVREIKGFFEDMSSRGFDVGSEVLESKITDPTQKNLGPFRLPTDGMVFALVRLRFVNGQPHHIVYTYLPVKRFPGIETYDFSQGSLYSILRREYGATLKRARYLAEASIVTEREIKLLGIEPGSPMLVIYSTVYNEEGVPIVFGYSRHRADKGQIEFEVVTSGKE
jgi:GntR family transcriptional regulator